MSSARDPSLSPQVFAILSALVEERTGLHHGAESREAFADRAAPRVAELGLETFLDYYYHLKYDDPAGAELQQLVDALVVSETYFFRELDQLEVVADLLAERARTAGRARAWSAACATGEEPLSLAMLLAERGVLEAVELVATDISTRALARARAGRYGPRSLRGPPPRRALDPWVRREGPQLVVRPELVARVRWLRLNLLDARALEGLGAFDAILCRNVLIYFREDAARRVVEALTRRLAPGGALFVGVSESLLRFGAPMRCEEQGGVFFYRSAS